MYVGFICAEITSADDILNKGHGAAKRKEGKEYVLQDARCLFVPF